MRSSQEGREKQEQPWRGAQTLNSKGGKKAQVLKRSLFALVTLIASRPRGGNIVATWEEHCGIRMMEEQLSSDQGLELPEA